MLNIVIATHNRDKLREIKFILSGLDVHLHTLDDFPELPEVVEKGETLRENAITKAQRAAKFTNMIALADDSGLEVDALGGEPGVRSARFAGESCTYDDNNEKLLRLLKSMPLDERGAKFRCVVAIVDGGKAEVIEGICRGFIALAPRGESGFGYDPIFVVPEYEKTFAELTPEVKNSISHRARALEKARKVVEKLLNPLPEGGKRE